MVAPLFIVAPGRSYTSLISAMLGQHPQAYGVLEFNLNAFDTMQSWWDATGGATHSFAHGLLRAVAQLRHGVQDPATIVAAQIWVRDRLHWSTDEMCRELAGQIDPRVMVEKSPAALYFKSEGCLERLLRFFPDARFIHLTRHPRPACRSVLKADWLRPIITRDRNAYDSSTTPPTLDPQKLWHSGHTKVRQFVGSLPLSRRLTIQSEAFLMAPDHTLERVASWLGLRTDRASIDEMKHPERSPFARLGPSNALYGSDLRFLQNPAFSPLCAEPESLKGPLEWRNDGRGFLPEVEALALEFGYG